MIVSIQLAGSYYEIDQEIVNRMPQKDGSVKEVKTGIKVTKISHFFGYIKISLSNGESIVFWGHPYKFVRGEKFNQPNQ